MPFDETRQKRRAGKFDDDGTGSGDACRGPYSLNALALDADGPSVVHDFAIEHPRRSKDGDRVRL